MCVTKHGKMQYKTCVNYCLSVKSTNRFPITLGPNEVKYFSNYAEQAADNGPPGVLVCPRLLSLRNTGRTKRVTVKVCNISASAVKSFPRSNICQVSQVQVHVVDS